MASSLSAGVEAPTRVARLPDDLHKLKRVVDRLARDGAVRVCYEASGASWAASTDT